MSYPRKTDDASMIAELVCSHGVAYCSPDSVGYSLGEWAVDLGVNGALWLLNGEDAQFFVDLSREPFAASAEAGKVYSLIPLAA